MKNTRKKYLTTKEMRERLIKGESMPTAIFSAKKTEYIVKPRGTIFGFKKKRWFNK